MRPILALIAVALFVPVVTSAAPTDKRHREAALAHKANTTLDPSLAGDISRPKDDAEATAPMRYDQFRLGVELQVREKRLEQIGSLKKILTYGQDPKETPGLLFRLGELYWEESKFYFFEANRKDDDLIAAINSKDLAGQEKAKREKRELLAKRDLHVKLAMEQYTTIVQRHKDYERTDEVLYFLGHNLMEMGEDRKSLVAYKRLIERYPKSKFLPDAYLAFGEYYFNNSKGRHEMLEKALEYYKKAAGYPENQVYGFALYKQGWCYFNMNDYPKAMDMWRAVILYGEFAGAAALEKDGGKNGKNTLIREARNDYVRAYSRSGLPRDAKESFSKVASKPDDLFMMEKQLANLYYDDGKDREAAITFAMLIHERPLSPEAPGFQGKIVDCILRTGNKQLTVKQVRQLVKITQDVEKSGNVKDDKDRLALKKARELSERTLSNLAVNWHNEAKKTRDDETFQLSNEVYGDYLALFSSSPKAYDLRFFWAELLNDNLQRYDKAAEQYTNVVLVDAKRIDGEKGPDGQWKVKPQKPGRWLTHAAYNAVLAYDEVIKKAEERGELKSPDAGDLKKSLEIPPLKKKQLEACQRYLKYLPKGEHRVEIGFKAARIFYAYHHYDEAIVRFSDIALNHPDYKFENGDRAGELAANLVLDSYNGLGDYAKVNEWARKFYANEKLASGTFRADLSKIIEQSSFKLVNALEEKKEYARAAEEYLKFVQDFPKTEIADTAIYNAATDYYRARMLEKAMATRNRLIHAYPKSKFVPICIFANAEGHESVGDFEGAAESYEAYARDYEKSLSAGERAKRSAKANHRKRPTSAAHGEVKEAPVQVWEESKAQQALLNAGVYRDGLGQMRPALKDREKFLELWPESKERDAVFLSIADLQEKNGAYARAVTQLEQYEKDNAKDPNKVLSTEAKILSLYRTRAHNSRRADAVAKRSLAFYEKLYHRQKVALDATALDPVGRALIAKYDGDYVHFARLKLKWGGMPDPSREFKKSLKEKTHALEEVQRLYTEVVKMKAADPAICALYKIGTAYQNMAESIANAPMPRGAPQELSDAIRDQLTQQATPVREKAADAFAAAVNKSHELQSANECSVSALKALRDGLRPDQFPAMPEETAELSLGSLKIASAGGELLNDIQPVTAVNLLNPPKATLAPVPPRTKAPGAAESPAAAPAGQIKEDDLSDLSEGKAPPVAPAPEPGKPPAEERPAPHKSSTEEPEDSL